MSNRRAKKAGCGSNQPTGKDGREAQLPPALLEKKNCVFVRVHQGQKASTIEFQGSAVRFFSFPTFAAKTS